jgi:penicillin-binding protein 1C
VGLPLPEGGDYYGYSLALGSAEVSLLNAHQRLPHAGQYRPLRHDAGAGRVHQAAPGRRAGHRCPRAAFIVGDVLADPNARALHLRPDSVLGTRFWTAVKTGTSKDMRDNWAIGWSQRYTVGVWVGNAAGAPMWDVSGTSGAAPVWAALMQQLHRAEPSRAPRHVIELVDTSGKVVDQRRLEVRGAGVVTKSARR